MPSSPLLRASSRAAALRSWRRSPASAGRAGIAIEATALQLRLDIVDRVRKDDFLACLRDALDAPPTVDDPRTVVAALHFRKNEFDAA